ncbi:octanoyltransferase, partial [Pelagibacteraceae bacterium]|nr:octanoyltransferase [Pelagibacteraceae bacterium]
MSIEIKFSKNRIPYEKAMLFLNKRVQEVKNGNNKELIWILEHPKIYTAGVSFKQNEIIDQKIKVIKTSRG